MEQIYSNYTAEHHWVWKQLFARQQNNLLQRGTALHNKNVDALQKIFNADNIPKLADLSHALTQKTNWKIQIVKGFIPAIDFLNLLAKREFAASTWLRKPEELDYLEEPDMFHDVFGHLPILCDPAYADFVQQVGLLGVKFAHSEQCINFIERFYWYSIEFGLIKENNQTKILGAGIISSYGETNRIFEDKTIDIRPFNLQEILYQPFDKSSLQPIYYVAENFEQLYKAVEELEKILEKELVAAELV
jgi:phenylalanine-4-hydroxylase